MIYKMYYDTPSGNISLTFIEENKELIKPYEKREVVTTYLTSEIGLDIDEVRKLSELTKEFLDWYDSGGL